MFAATIEAGKLERALDLVERLHLEKSFDLAMTIANNHRKLVDLIEDVRNNKFPPQEPDYTEPDYDDHYEYDEEDAPTQRITPDSNQARKAKRALEDAPLADSGPAREVRRKSAFA
jgi:chromosome transmission fidelity protein 4